MNNKEIKLDNPVWYSLSETHQHYSIDYGDIKFYHPDYCPFGGFHSSENCSAYIDEYSKLVDNFFIVGNMPLISNDIHIRKQLICLQMVIHDKIELEIKDHIVLLGKEYSDALYDLVTMVQPGYFKHKTASIGNYYGIFKNEQLVSVSGERMAMDGFVEVSAIVTHPDHTGKGFAKQLIAYAVNNILRQGSIPYLHVTESNSRAISLYEKLGFSTRRKMSFWNIVV